MKFPYLKLKNRSPEGRESVILRPVIPIGIRYHGQVFPGRYYTLIDSGADNCLFHADIAVYLGMDITRGEEKEFGGVGFGKIIGYVHRVDIQVGGWWIACPVAFTDGLWRDSRAAPGKKEGLYYGVLGQEGFFDQFRVTFDRAANEVELRPKGTATPSTG
jgi:hypothetical protein